MCGCVGGQGSQYTQKSHTLTFWSWETLKSQNVWCLCEVKLVLYLCVCLHEYDENPLLSLA